ncbi:hypothetical protein MASR1M45_24380 [Candidatus Kapaibacterium sp.]
MELFLSIVIAYLVGTFPSSYLLVKYFGNKNIHESGSGNPGALNSYESTGSRGIGAGVLILDFIKGAVAAYITFLIGGNDYLPFMVGIIWVIIGHNYNVFFGGKGGRGLATAAGAFAIISPYIVITWLVMWAMGYYVIRKNVHVANAIALVGAPILLFSSPSKILEITNMVPVNDFFAVKLAFALACLLILLRHIKPLKELFTEK